MRKIDITDKLDLEGNTLLIIAGEGLEVKTDAKTALLLMGKINQGAVTNETVMEICDLIFTEEAREKLDGMNLSFKDYSTVVKEAMNAITGKEDEPGEGQTHTTT